METPGAIGKLAGSYLFLASGRAPATLWCGARGILLSLLQPRWRTSTAFPLSTRQIFQAEDGFLDLFSFRSQFGEHFVDVHAGQDTLIGPRVASRMFSRTGEGIKPGASRCVWHCVPAVQAEERVAGQRQLSGASSPHAFVEGWINR